MTDIVHNIRKGGIQELESAEENLRYWLSRTPEERLSAVEHLRRQWYGNSERLQRVVRVIKRA